MIPDGYVKVVGVPAAWGQFLYFFIKHHDPLSEHIYAPEGIYFHQYIFVPLKNQIFWKSIWIAAMVLGRLKTLGTQLG